MSVPTITKTTCEGIIFGRIMLIQRLEETLKMFCWLMVPQRLTNTLRIVFLSFVTYLIWLCILI